MRTLITSDHVLAYDGTSHALLRDGAVAIDDDTIAWVGPAAAAPEHYDERIDLGDSLLMPGLIDLDALTDIDHLILDSWWAPEHMARLQWSTDYFDNRREHVFTAAERQRVREYAITQLALHGITSFMPIASEVHSEWAESYEDFVAVADYTQRIGLRGFLGPAYRSGVNTVAADGTKGVSFAPELGEAGFAEAVRFLDYVAELADPRVTGVLLPCRIETLTPELLRKTADTASERGVLVRLHALQGHFERDYLVRERGMTPLELLAESGLLNDRLIIPHGTVIDINPAVHGEDRGDLGTLVDAGVSIVHCPLTNGRYGSHLETFGRYADRGVNIALGSDSFPPDLIRGIDVGVQAAKIQNGDLSRGDLARYVEALTLGGARALNRDDLGRIAVGAQADLTAFSLSDVRIGPLEDPLRTLVLGGTARDANLTMVAGTVVMRDGKVPGVDLELLKREGQELFDKLRSAYAGRDYLGGTTEELFPPVFGAYGDSE